MGGNSDRTAGRPDGLTPAIRFSGWAAWKRPMGELGFLLYAGYGLLFMIAGRPDTYYWGVMVAPAVMVGLAFAVPGLRALIAAATAPALEPQVRCARERIAANGNGMNGPRVLLVVGGGIAAYKSCELIRVIRKSGGEVTCVLTEGGAKFVTPMALAALSENPVYTSLFDLKDEVEMGHIQLSREADIVVVCPATANLMAKMASGIADDLATTVLLATDKPVMAVPAMNVRMWQH